MQRPESLSLKPCVIFLETAIFVSNDALRARLQDCYRIPHLFWTRLCQRSNGYFGCEDVCDDNCLPWHNTWFRFQIKQLSKVPTIYTWSEFTFFTTGTPTGAHTILCFDSNAELRSVIHDTLLSEVDRMLSDVYLIHSALVSKVLELYDKSVWALRDHVRDIEKKRMNKPEPETDYHLMHELARHACHSSETLLVAIETISNMHMQYSSFLEGPSPYAASVRLRQLFNFQTQILKGQHARSVTIEARLKNELNLAINLVAQQESAATVRTSEAARSDGAAMRAVSVISLVFLPFTFVSTIFSTTFFAFIPSSSSGPASWAVSEQFWIYWVVSIPLTMTALSAWLWWQKRYKP